jgi:hypothetical protein
LAFSSCSTVDFATDAAPTSRFTRALMTRCSSPVARAMTETSARRSSRRRSRFSCADSLTGSVVVNATSAGDGAGAASANS